MHGVERAAKNAKALELPEGQISHSEKSRKLNLKSKQGKRLEAGVECRMMNAESRMQMPFAEDAD
jgi:hypothetical protein